MNVPKVALVCVCVVINCMNIVNSVENVMIDGQLTTVVDNCSPGNDSTCGTGECCTQVRLSSVPDATGPQPTSLIACKPYSKKGDFCLIPTTNAYCPCVSSLRCTVNNFYPSCN